MKYTYLLLILPTLLLLQCSDADTLGDEPPVEVVITGNATYAGGIGELLELKCGYCHAYPLPDLAPDNIITDLDLTVYDTRIQDGRVIRGADAIGRFLHDGVLDHELNIYADNRVFPAEPVNMRQMPLDYGTPLTPSERTALLNWSATGSPRDDNGEDPQGDSDAGSSLWGSCNFCHGFTGDGFEFEGRWLGSPIRPESVTRAKIKSMWLWSQGRSDAVPEPLSDEAAGDLRAFIIGLRAQ